MSDSNIIEKVWEKGKCYDWSWAERSLIGNNPDTIHYSELKMFAKQCLEAEREEIRKKIEALGTLEMRDDDTGVLILKSKVLEILGDSISK